MFYDNFCGLISINQTPSYSKRMGAFAFCHLCDEYSGLRSQWLVLTLVLKHCAVFFRDEDAFLSSCGDVILIYIFPIWSIRIKSRCAPGDNIPRSVLSLVVKPEPPPYSFLIPQENSVQISKGSDFQVWYPVSTSVSPCSPALTLSKMRELCKPQLRMRIHTLR